MTNTARGIALMSPCIGSAVWLALIVLGLGVLMIVPDTSSLTSPCLPAE